MDDTQSKRIEKYFQERAGIMKTKRNRLLQKMTAWICVFSFLCPVLNVSADELDSMERKSSGLQSELDSLNGEILQISEEIADNEVEMETVNNNIIRAQEQLEIAKNNEDAYYEDMKVRIQYIYENSDASLLEMIFSAESLSELVNKVHFVQKLSEYDRGMFQALQDLRSTIEEEEKSLKEQQNSYKEMEEELNKKWEELNKKATSTSTDLTELKAAIAELKAQQAAQQNAQANNSANSNTGNSESTGNGQNNNGSNNNGSNNGGSNNGGGYNYPSGPGQLNPWIGVVYFNGHRETYYSQKVLPGYGLNIPGRHVASDGTVRDENNYICVASSDHPKGTIVETSLGTGKVYDSGCASGTIDIYTDW